MNEPSGNPVFDFRAAHRLRAASVQRILLLGGVLGLGGGLALWLFGSAPRWAALGIRGLFCGALLLVVGVAWGFWWRRRLRSAFQREYGLKHSPFVKEPRTK